MLELAASVRKWEWDKGIQFENLLQLNLNLSLSQKKNASIYVRETIALSFIGSNIYLHIYIIIEPFVLCQKLKVKGDAFSFTLLCIRSMRKESAFNCSLSDMIYNFYLRLGCKMTGTGDMMTSASHGLIVVLQCHISI